MWVRRYAPRPLCVVGSPPYRAPKGVGRCSFVAWSHDGLDELPGEQETDSFPEYKHESTRPRIPSVPDHTRDYRLDMGDQDEPNSGFAASTNLLDPIHTNLSVSVSGVYSETKKYIIFLLFCQGYDKLYIQ